MQIKISEKFLYIPLRLTLDQGFCEMVCDGKFKKNLYMRNRRLMPQVKISGRI